MPESSMCIAVLRIPESTAKRLTGIVVDFQEMELEIENFKDG